MKRVRWYLVGTLMLLALAGSLAGCGRGWLQFAEREPWRAEAEKACLNSGTVRETANLVRISPISGPGVCGAEFPLKVAALGETSAMGYVADMRPPGAIPNAGSQPRWPGAQPNYQPGAQPVYSSPPPQSYPSQPAYPSQPPLPRQAYPSQPSPPSSYPPQSGQPISLAPPGAQPPEDEDEFIDEPQLQQQPQMRPRGAPAYPAPIQAAPAPRAPPALGPSRAPQMLASNSVQVKPTATLACPLVSALDKWILEAVQPAATRWFGAQVVEIKQISAYSCRGMNGQPGAHISEHAFGNALDVAAFTLADGRRISVKDGWRGLPEEQGFLRDVQAAACQQFTTVLAPGSNAFHYDHIHVDLMRRSSGRVICQPGAVSGEEIAARAQRNGRYAGREPQVTGSLGGRKASRRMVSDDDWIEDESHIRDNAP
jgi:hypothetical protein